MLCLLLSRLSLHISFYFHSRLFGATGQCAHCSKTILPLEMVMRAREHTYHLDCFACHICQYRFCVGDKFFLHFQVVLCEADYYDITSIFNVNDMAYYVWLPVISPLILLHHFREVWKRTGRDQLTIKKYNALDCIPPMFSHLCPSALTW